MPRLRMFAATMIWLSLALATASIALAKGQDAIATLDGPLPVDAAPGTDVAIGWSLTIAQDDDSTLPFSAEGVFVRLQATSSEPVEVVGVQDRIGHYVATVTVPDGGLGAVEFGLRGTACYPEADCERVDHMFQLAKTTAGAAIGAVASRPLATEVPAQNAPATVPAPTTPADGSPLPIVLMALAGAAIIGGFVLLLARGRKLTPHSTRS